MFFLQHKVFIQSINLNLKIYLGLNNLLLLRISLQNKLIYDIYCFTKIKGDIMKNSTKKIYLNKQVLFSGSIKKVIKSNLHFFFYLFICTPLFSFTFNAFAQPFAYITNQGDNTVAVIDTATNVVTDTINLSIQPLGIAVSNDGSRIYAGSLTGDAVAVIDTSTNTVITNINVGFGPWGVAVNPDGSRVFVANTGDDTVSVIDTSTNSVVDTINIVGSPQGVAVSRDGSSLYVSNSLGDTVSKVDTSTNTLVNTVNVGNRPSGIAVSPDGSRVYVVLTTPYP